MEKNINFFLLLTIIFYFSIFFGHQQSTSIYRYWSEGSETWEEYSGGGEADGLVRGNNNTYQPVEHRLRPPVFTSRVR